MEMNETETKLLNGNLPKWQILLAEDDEVSQEIIISFLRDESSLELTVTSDGREALVAALSKKFDLLIVDQNMPNITGRRLVRHLRAGRSTNATTPVIHCTAHASTQSMHVQTIDGGRELTLSKPLKSEDLLAAVWCLIEVPK